MPDPDQQPYISVRNFTLRNNERVVLDNINLNIFPGEVVAIVGESGGGKTTFGRSLDGWTEGGGAWHRVAGEILVRGVDTRNMDPKILVRRVRRLLQDLTIIPGSIFKNVAIAPKLAFGIRHGMWRQRFAAYLRKQPRPVTPLDMRVEQALRWVGLWDAVCNDLSKSAEDLSGGQRQRICLARTLAYRSPALILDEATSALDAATKLIVLETLRNLKQVSGQIIILITHDEDFAAALATRVVRFDHGRVVADGLPQAVLKNKSTKRGHVQPLQLDLDLPRPDLKQLQFDLPTPAGAR